MYWPLLALGLALGSLVRALRCVSSDILSFQSDRSPHLQGSSSLEVSAGLEFGAAGEVERARVVSLRWVSPSIT